ncbi:hypothetical protein DERF_004199 [Dermatophagoides farinae]|uniref:Uncharacterized protein n=1 Tax=Dermatophagoides farinae TaxID=6954 RepID=A0A922L9S6_DERFA|nr:hypothetical protein DERF_004199 [Dermatophagoides farinae]
MRLAIFEYDEITDDASGWLTRLQNRIVDFHHLARCYSGHGANLCASYLQKLNHRGLRLEFCSLRLRSQWQATSDQAIG